MAAVSAETPYFRFKAGSDADRGAPGAGTDSPAFAVQGPSGAYVARVGRAHGLPAASSSTQGVTWEMVGAVPGVSVHPTSGAFLGAPSGTGVFTARVRGSLAQADGTVRTADSAPFTLTVLGAPATLAYAPSTTVPVNAGMRLYPASASNLSAQATYTLLDAPSWMRVEAGGVVTGTPSAAAGPASVRVVARDFDGETVTSQPFTVAVDGTFASLGAQDVVDAVVGVPTSMSFVPMVGLTKPVTYTVSAGRLPDGVEIDAANDRIAGKPREAGTFAGIVVTAKDARDVTVPTRAFSVTVGTAALSYADRSAPVGQEFEASPSARNLAGASYAIAPALPDGQSIDPGTGRISGRMGAGSQAYVVTATTPWLTVPSNPFTLAGAAGGFSVSAAATTVRAHVGYPVSLAFTASASPVTWKPGGTALPDGLSLDKATGKVTGEVNQAATVRGATAVATDGAGRTAESAPVTYDVLPLPAVSNREAYFAVVGTPVDEALSASNVIGTPAFALSGTLPPGLTLGTDGRLRGTPTAAGEATGLVASVTDSHDGAPGRGAPFSVSVRAASTALAVDGVQDAYRVRVGKALATPAPVALNATSTPEWSMDPDGAALPAGLRVDPATGVVSGSPAAPGTTSNLVLRVKDGTKPGYARSRAFAVQAAEPLAVAGVDGSYALRVATPLRLDPVPKGALGPLTWELAGGALPRALSFDPGTGQVAGAPLVAGTLPGGSPAPADGGGYYLRARDAFDGEVADSRRFAIEVQPGLVVIGPDRYRATVGLPFSSAGTVFAKGASGPVGWSLTGAERPAWLEVDGQTGVMSGTPGASGTYKGLRLVARSGEETGSTADITIEVTGGLRASAPATVRAHKGRAYGWMTPTATDATGSVSWGVAAGNLPPGMSLNPATGTVGGTPTLSGTFSGVRLRATDASGRQGVTDDIAFVVDDGLAWTKVTPPTFLARSGAVMTGLFANPVLPNAIGKVTFAKAPAGTKLCFWGCPDDTMDIDAATGAVTLRFNGAARSGNDFVPGAFVATDETGASVGSPYDTAFGALPGLNLYDCYDTVCADDAVVGVSYRKLAEGIEGVIGPARWEAVPGTNPPDWLDVDAATGKVTGTPPAPGVFDYTLKVTDSDGATSSKRRRITVRPYGSPDPTHDYIAVRYGTFRAFQPLVAKPAGDFDNIDPSWKRKPYNEGALMTSVNDTGLVSNWAQYLAPGDYFDNNVKAIGRDGSVLVDYTYDLRVHPKLDMGYPRQEACIRTGDSLFLKGPEVSGKVGALSFGNDTGGPANVPAWITLDPSTGDLTGTAPDPGTYGSTDAVYLYARDAADGAVTQSYAYSNVRVYQKVEVIPPPQEALNALNTNDSAYLPFTLKGAAYGGKLTVLEGLPPGMNRTQFWLEGTPSAAGVYPVKMRWDPQTCGTPPLDFTVTLVVNATDRPYGVLPKTLYYRQGVYGQSPPVSVAYPDGIAYAWSGGFGGVASPLRIDPSAGFVYGTPTQPGIESGYRISAYAYANGRGYGMYTNRFDIVVTSKPTVSVSASVPAHVGTAATVTPTVTDFVGPVAWSLAGTPPPGMSFDTRTGSLSGVPTEAGTYAGLVVTGTETEAPTDANGTVQARQSASSAPFAVEVTTGPSIAGVHDIDAKAGQPVSLQATATGLVGTARWTLIGTLPDGTLTLDRDAGLLSGTPTAAVDGTYRLLVVDGATDATATSEPFRIKVALESALPGTWKWGAQVCTYGCTEAGCSGRQTQTCEGPGCTVAVRGCDAPYYGGSGGTSYPVGQEARSCPGETTAPNEAFCPKSNQFTQWLYWPTAYQTKNTAGFIVISYSLGCFGTSGQVDSSLCGAPPTTVTSCRMNGYGKGWCDPVVPFAGAMMNNGYETDANWYD